MLPYTRQSFPNYLSKRNLLFTSSGVSWHLAPTHNINNACMLTHTVARFPAVCPYLLLVNNNLLFTCSWAHFHILPKNCTLSHNDALCHTVCFLSYLANNKLLFSSSVDSTALVHSHIFSKHYILSHSAANCHTVLFDLLWQYKMATKGSHGELLGEDLMQITNVETDMNCVNCASIQKQLNLPVLLGSIWPETKFNST